MGWDGHWSDVLTFRTLTTHRGNEGRWASASLSVRGEASLGSEVLLALPPPLVKPLPLLLLLQNGAPLGSVCPGLLGTSSEGAGGCECALKVLTATLLVTRIPRKLICSRSDQGETLPRLRSY